MSLFRSSAAALLVTTALTPAAWADVSAQDVWQQLQDYYSLDQNSEITFDSAEQSGATLTVTNLVFSSGKTETMGDAEITSMAKVDMGDMRFIENGDGTVSVEIAEEMDAHIQVTSSDEYDDDMDLRMVLGFDDTRIKVSEDGDARIYDSRSAAVTVSFPEGFGEDMKAIGANTITLTNAASMTRLLQGARWEASSTLSAETVKLDFGLEDENGEGIIALITYEGLTGQGEMSFPDGIDMGDPAALFAGDVTMTAELAAGPSKTDMRINADGDNMVMAGTDESSSISVSVKDGAIGYNVTGKGFELAVSGDVVPFPISVTGNEMGFGLLMPLTKTDMGEASLSLIFDGIELGDPIWNMADPGEILPRGPLTIRAGISGALEVLADLFDEDAMMDAMMSEVGMPMLPKSARIDELRIEGVGVSARGEGAVDFDAEDMVSYDGMPAPIGDVTINASGVNGLIDNLITMGILPEDQAMMTRMMIGMFSESAGDDALRSHIEFKEGGHIFANGQQLR